MGEAHRSLAVNIGGDFQCGDDGGSPVVGGGQDVKGVKGGRVLSGCSRKGDTGDRVATATASS
jgi:hypothetical protein